MAISPLAVPKLTHLARDASDTPIQVGLFPYQAHHAAFTSQTSVIMTAIQSGIQLVQLIATQPCHYKLGTGSFAVTTNDVYLPANVPETINVRDQYLIGVIGATGGTAGTLHTCEKV